MQTKTSWNKFIAGLFVIIAFVAILALSGCNNTKNGIGVDVSKIPTVFVDSGYTVKNHQNRAYHIVADMNGYLYYCSDVDGTLAPVFDAEGNPTKDIAPFEELTNG